MYEYNERTDNNHDNPSKIDKKFLDALSEFIQSIESELDIMLPRSASLQFLSYYKIIDYIISQKLNNNIIIRLLCPLDEDSGRLTKQLVPFVGYKSIKLSLPKTLANSLFFVRDKKDIFLLQLIYKSNNNMITRRIERIIKTAILFFLLMIGYIQITSL